MKRLLYLIFVLGSLTARAQSVDGGLKTLTATGTDTYVISEPLPAAYDPKERFLVSFPNPNTITTPTLNRASLGAKFIKNADGTNPAIGAITGRQFLSYNGTYYQIVGGGSGGGGSGTVTSVSVTTANGVSGSVATATTTPAISLTLGAITPTSVNSVVLSGASTPTLAVTGTSTISGTHSGSSSGTNTGDQTITLTGAVTGTGTGSFATTIATPGTLTVSSTNSTATAHTHAITSSSTPGAAASLLATDGSGHIGSTGTRIVKGWFTDLQVTNPISGSITGNAATVTTNANLTGDVTSSGNATTIANDAVTFAKFQNITDARLLGRSAGSSGDMQEITVGSGLSLSAGNLTATSNGDVVGPASSTDNAIARFDLATGKLIQNSAVTIDDAGSFAVGTDATNIRTFAATGSSANHTLRLQSKGSSATSTVQLVNDAGQGLTISPSATPNAQFSIGDATLLASNITGVSATASNLTIKGGNGLGTDDSGGNLNLYGGGKTGSGIEGSVNIQTATGKLGFFAATAVVKQSAVTTKQGIADVLTAYGLLPSSTLVGSDLYYSPNALSSTATDADFTATVNAIKHLPDGVLSTNRVVTIPVGSNGDVIELYNNEDTYTWTFAGATVYLADRTTTVTTLLYNVPTLMRKINGIWIITN